VRKRIDNAKLGTVLSIPSVFGGTNATLVFKRMDAEILFLSCPRKRRIPRLRCQSQRFVLLDHPAFGG